LAETQIAAQEGGDGFREKCEMSSMLSELDFRLVILPESKMTAVSRSALNAPFRRIQRRSASFFVFRLRTSFASDQFESQLTEVS